MGTLRGGYWIGEGKDRERVPSVTTVISRFKESGGLIHWAWDLGMKGVDYREVRDTAADAGTAAHAMVEADIRGRDFDPTAFPADVLDLAQGAFNAYKEWKAQTKLVSVASEVPLVSAKHKFGGTLDAMLINGLLALGDWKSANKIYPDNLMQLAAYGALWDENNPDNPVRGGFHLLRFDKTHGDFEHRYFARLDNELEEFLLLVRAYALDKKLKERIR